MAKGYPKRSASMQGPYYAKDSSSFNPSGGGISTIADSSKNGNFKTKVGRRMKMDKQSKKAAPKNTASESSPLVPTKLSNEDVLMGRGPSAGKRTGNRQFRQLVLANQKEYQTRLDKKQKSGLVLEVLRLVQESGGRFVEELDGLYYEVSLERTTNKISQALREKKGTKKIAKSVAANLAGVDNLSTNKIHASPILVKPKTSKALPISMKKAPAALVVAKHTQRAATKKVKKTMSTTIKVKVPLPVRTAHTPRIEPTQTQPPNWHTAAVDPNQAKQTNFRPATPDDSPNLASISGSSCFPEATLNSTNPPSLQATPSISLLSDLFGSSVFDPPALESFPGKCFFDDDEQTGEVVTIGELGAGVSNALPNIRLGPSPTTIFDFESQNIAKPACLKYHHDNHMSPMMVENESGGIFDEGPLASFDCHSLMQEPLPVEFY